MIICDEVTARKRGNFILSAFHPEFQIAEIAQKKGPFYECKIHARVETEPYDQYGYSYTRPTQRIARVSSLAENTERLYHNVLGPALIACEVFGTSMRIRWKRFYLFGVLYNEATGFERIDPAMIEMCKTLGFEVVGEYIVRMT